MTLSEEKRASAIINKMIVSIGWNCLEMIKPIIKVGSDSSLQFMWWFRRNIHQMEQTSVLFRLISVLLFALEMFTSFHTYLGSHSGAPGLSALS